MKILTYPNDTLRVKCRAVEKVTPELVATAQEMLKVMREGNGIGLAAPQVGLDLQLFVMDNKGESLICFNPVILKRSKENEYAGEGCLSFPGITRMIKRSLEVTMKYRDEHNKMQYIILKGLQARCAVHEHDHLFSRLFIDLQEKA